MPLLGLASSRNDDADEAAKYDHLIQLVDHTKYDDGDKSPSEPSSGTQTPLEPKQSRRLNRASIREDLAKRGLARQKYAKWQQDRFETIGQPSASTDTGLVQIDTKSAQLRLEETEQNTDTSSKDGDAIARKKSKLERGKNRVKGLVNSKKLIQQSKEEDAVVDVLYENQRGSFFFGIPLFSSKSLLNFDPAAWVDGKFKAVPVNITNAAVPDPSWDWAWPSWYVDMSHDVDEEGWQYSFSFRHGFAWHGTHPWFHSFVRRRRWLRKRVRKGAAAKGQPNPKNFNDAHLLTAEYFTIHPPKKRPNYASESLTRSSSLTRFNNQDVVEQQDDEISDIPRLIRRLKRASIDREKIVLVRRFLDEGGEELYYLAEQMPIIMSLLVFQSSRRQLLSLLFRHFEAASAHREAHQDRDQPESSAESRKIDNLLNALHAADEECRQLEYWSDIRHVTRRGDSLGAVDESHGWGHGWEGLDDSGPGEKDDSGAERFKEKGTPEQQQYDNESESVAKDAVDEKQNTDSNTAEQNGHEQKNGHKDKGKGKAEL